MNVLPSGSTRWAFFFEALLADFPGVSKPVDCTHCQLGPPVTRDMTQSIPFEDALTELQQIVNSLETGQVSLEQSLSQFERGVSLVSHCKSLLDQAHQRVEMVVSRLNAETVETAPFDVSATADGEVSANPEESLKIAPAKSRKRRPEPDQKDLFS